MYTKKLCYIAAALLLAICSVGQAAAQMSDSQVEAYVKAGVAAGKGETQIGRELLARGVTPAQIERLKELHEANQGSETHVADQSVGGQVRERLHDSSDDLTAGSLDGVAVAVEDQPRRSRIYGHGVFTGRALTFEPNENMATPEHYRLGPGDEVIIDIWGANEDNIRQRITPEGNIMISQIGPVYLNGLTIHEANSKLRSIFAQKYAGVSGDDPDSDIRVTLGQIRSIQVNVFGEVATPGTYRLSSFATVFHALYRAGGITSIGSLRNIRVIRGGRELAPIDLYKYLFNGKLTDDFRLEEGDAIIVPTYENLAEISGNVKRPMWYELKSGETLGQLIDYAGGFTGDAYRDDARLVRQTGREYKIFNVANTDFGSFVLEDGDAVTIGATLDRFANRVEVRGSVYRPGMYQLSDGVRTVRDLIRQADGLMEDAFLDRVLLYRETEDLRLEMKALDLRGILAGTTADIALRRNDVLHIPSTHEVEERGPLTINGYVARPGVYPFAEHTTIEDLILQAGGLLDGASTARVEVSRRIKDPQSLTETSEIGRTYTFSIKEGLVMDGQAGFELAPYDVVQIRRSPGYQAQRSVTVNGEVLFPGGYTLLQKNERLTDLVQRAGGVTKDAYTRGARLVRLMDEEERAVREATLRQARLNRNSADSVATERLSLADHYSVGIELDKALKEPGSHYDIVLREGDRLVIPEYIGTVKVSGEVLYPNTVVYMEGKKLKHYISQAGGFGSRAKRSKIYVVYMNGTVAQSKTCRKPRIEPGCEIIVPTKRERRHISISDILGLSTSAASIGVMGASIANMSK